MKERAGVKGVSACSFAAGWLLPGMAVWPCGWLSLIGAGFVRAGWRVRDRAEPGRAAGALRARVVSVPTLLAVIGLPTLELGIIPFEAAVPVSPLTGFRLYDDLVIVESMVGEQQLPEADDVARYEKYLELLRDTASTGTEAAEVIRRSLESLR